MGDVGFEADSIVEMNSRTPVYNAPYRDILGTEHQGNLEDSLAILSDGFVLYDESRMFDAALFRRLRETLDARTEHESAVVRKLLREDKTHLFPEIPEAWWWIFFWRLCWNFHYEPDPWFEIKWWVWLEMRGKQGAMNMAGCQNCLGRDVPVLMADGSRKPSQEIQVGDLLMGPDSTPRRVLRLHRGTAPLYKIQPKVGDSWTCTGNHKLELECTRPRTNGSGTRSRKHFVGARTKVTPEEWLGWSDAMKISYKQVHAGVELPHAFLPLDPYIFGLWIGDGTKKVPSLTTADIAISDEWVRHFQDNGYGTRISEKPGNLACTIDVTRGPKIGQRSILRVFLSKCVVGGSKRIPAPYLKSSRAQRLELLAGIVDTDGTNGGTYISVAQADKRTILDIKHLAESLGFLTSIRKKISKYRKQDGNLADHYLLSIIGDFTDLPLRLEYKKPRKDYGKGCRKPQCTGISILPLGEGEFFGWTVDKDNMFLLGNGCITNNSGKSMFGATFPLIQLIVWDRDCKSYLSGPYKSHTDDKVWAELQTQHSILKNHGIPVREAFGIEIVENRNEYYVETDKGKGIIKFVASQEAASVVGSKTKDHSDTSGRKGISLFMVDEYVENVNTEMERGFGNFRSNYNSLLVLACNPDPMRALHPNVVSFIDPIDRKRSEMKKDRDFRWRTRKGIVVRFDWNNCPNRIVGKNRWPYLMNEQRRSKQEMESDDVRAGQLDAWPFGSEGANSLTDTSRQTAAGVFSDFHYENSPHMRLFSLDPAFGGDDPAVYTILEVAKTNISGRIMDRFVGFEQGYIHGIDSDFVADPKFCEKVAEIIAYRESKGDRDMKFLREIRPGSQVGPMAQGAVEAAHLCIVKGIPFDCFTFDASQRADCYDWIVKVFGHQNLVWWYEGSRRLITEEGEDWFRWPFRTRDDRQHGSRHEKWSDYCGRVITMIWAFACELINNGYLANGDAVRKSLTELGAREVASTSTGKVDVWSKEDIKRGTFQGRKIPKMKSPAWGETLAMGLYFGARFKHAVQLGEMPELSTHFGAAQTDWDDWLDLHERY